VYNTYDGTTLKTFVKNTTTGALSASAGTACSGTGTSGSSNLTEIGGNPNSSYTVSAQNFIVSDAFIFNTNLTQAQLAQFETRAPRDNTPNLVGFWRLDENTGSTAFDHGPFRANLAKSGTGVGWAARQQPYSYR